LRERERGAECWFVLDPAPLRGAFGPFVRPRVMRPLPQLPRLPRDSVRLAPTSSRRSPATTRPSASSQDEGPSTSGREGKRRRRSAYEVLGVDASATEDEVRAAFRARIKSVHPDVSDAREAGRETEEVVRAYNALLRRRGGDDIFADADAADDDEEEEGGSVFTSVTGPAVEVFVNGAYCRRQGGCPDWCCCCATCPEAFRFREEDGVAELVPGAVGASLRGLPDTEDADDKVSQRPEE